MKGGPVGVIAAPVVLNATRSKVQLIWTMLGVGVLISDATLQGSNLDRNGWSRERHWNGVRGVFCLPAQICTLR